jgi:D-3-phosphoglycerate dehydrogenase
MKILVCDEIHPSGLELLKTAGYDVDVRLNLNSAKLRSIVRDYRAVIVRSKTEISKEIIDAMTKGTIVVRAGVGLDNIDVGAAKSKGIQVANTPEAVSHAAAELAVGLMISVARRIPYADQGLKKNAWPKSGLVGIELSGKTLGIIGIGKIGAIVARAGKALGMKLMAYDIIRYEELIKELGIEFVPLEVLLKNADFITLHVTLTPETYYMIGEREIALMKPTTVIINTARGGLINEKSLYSALASGRLAGAALDVFEVEPPTNLDLAKLPNVVATPHIGAQTQEAQTQASVLAARKIIELTKR